MLETEAKERLKLSQGRGQKVEEKGREKIPHLNVGKSREHAAKIVGVNDRYIADVKRVAEKLPELLSKMKAGEISISEALVEAGFRQSVEAMTSKFKIKT